MEVNRKIKIICEEVYAESIWCKQILNGLQRELKKRRCSYVKTFVPDEIKKEDHVYVIGMSKSWLEYVITACNQCDCVPVVLSNLSKRCAGGQYHYICPNVYGVMTELLESCVKAGRTQIALYGPNYTSDLDMDRMRIFMELMQSAGNVYQNTGNLETCFRSFFPYADRYDVVICVSGYAAVSLAKKLEKESPQALEKLVIVSWEEVLRHSRYNQWISLVTLNLESFGATAVAVAEMSLSGSNIAAITVEMEGAVCDIPDNKQVAELAEADSGETLPLEDPEMICMAKIEQVMRDADDMDHHIIAMLLDHAKYSEIADSCFMTEGNVKYRVKKYMSICGCKTKKELLELLQEYLR